ncbi:MAG: ribbon-helix-helix protein, CopG family [Dehalococcoidia bacterium]|nr:ribbon-helix-helix protein, CopG family [Dehalococcoidia bacterium]
MYDRRLQILIDQDRYELLTRLSRVRRVSLAELIREAIDRTYAATASGRRLAAWERIQASEPIPLPATVDELGEEIAEHFAGDG